MMRGRTIYSIVIPVLLVFALGLWALADPQRLLRPVLQQSLRGTAEPSQPAPSGERPEGKPQRPQGFNLMLLGVDSWSDNKARADMIMIAHVNPVQKKINLISIPRDTRVKVAGVGYTKLNHTHIVGEMAGGNGAGTQATLAATAALLDCSITSYIKVNFRGFADFIDSIDGLDITLEEPVKLTYGHQTLPAGTSHINGATALDLVRERASLSDGDFGRQRNQQLVLRALGEKLLKPEHFSDLLRLIRKAKTDILDTNLSDLELFKLAWTFKQIPLAAVSYHQLPGRSAYARDPLTRSILYYWVPDTQKTKRLGAAYLQ